MLQLPLKTNFVGYVIFNNKLILCKFCIPGQWFLLFSWKSLIKNNIFLTVDLCVIDTRGKIYVDKKFNIFLIEAIKYRTNMDMMI